MHREVHIPSLFRPFESEAPFQSCNLCEVNLLHPAQHYAVEKVMRQMPGIEVPDIVLEYAICMNCMWEMRQNMSAESMERMDAFLSQTRHPPERGLPSDEDESWNPDTWTTHCMVTGKPLTECRDYQVVGLCHGDKLVLSNDTLSGALPGILSAEVMEELQELLSPETKEELDGYFDRLTGWPPELRELMPKRLLPV